jgi:hypothetical protein
MGMRFSSCNAGGDQPRRSGVREVIVPIPLDAGTGKSHRLDAIVPFP